jgi:hypothetical protein
VLSVTLRNNTYIHQGDKIIFFEKGLKAKKAIPP